MRLNYSENNGNFLKNNMKSIEIRFNEYNKIYIIRYRVFGIPTLVVKCFIILFYIILFYTYHQK